MVNIFIVGPPRSGTTLLRAILSQHESIFSTTESMDLSAQLRLDHAKFCRDQILVANGKMPLYKLNTPAFLDFEAAVNDKKIFLFRDGRDAVLSYWLLTRDNVNALEYSYLCKYWNEIVAYMQSMLNQYDSIKAVKYEDLVASPEKTITDICDFLSLEYNAAMLNFYQSTNGINIPAGQEDWHQNLKVAITGDRVGRYKTEMTPEQLDQFMQVNETLLNSIGYS